LYQFHEANRAPHHADNSPLTGALKIASRIQRQCRVCRHVAKTEIELALAGGAGQTALAKKHGLSKDSVQRHWARHVPEERKARLLIGPVQAQALAARLSEENSSVLDNLKIIRAGLYEAYDAAVRAGDRNSIALLAGRLHENQRLVGTILGDLASTRLVQNTTINNFGDSAEYVRLIEALRQFGREHPQVMPALCAMLERLDDPAPAQLPALEHRPTSH
jgi:hypothetical protein